MSTVQKVALLFGIVFLAIGLLGFATTPATMEASLEHAPRLLGIFPVNLLHNAVHLIFGLWGLLGARRPGSARAYAKAVGLIYLFLAVLALVTPTTFGYIPIGGNDIWLHALIGAVLTFVGFRGRDALPVPAGPAM